MRELPYAVSMYQSRSGIITVGFFLIYLYAYLLKCLVISFYN